MMMMMMMFEEYEDSTTMAYDTITDDDDDLALKIIHSAHALKSDDRARGDEIGADAV